MQGQLQRSSSQAHTHNHLNQGQICEECCYRIATQDQNFFGLGETIYLFQRACCVVIEDAWANLRGLGRNGLPHADEKVEAAKGPKIPWTEVLSENLYVAGQAIGFVAMLLGGIVFGFAAMFSSLFPGSSGGGGGHAVDHAADDAARRKRDDEQRKKDDDDRRKEDDDYWANYDKDRQKLNSTPAYVRGVDAGDGMFKEDVQRVNEINNALKGVENGTESKDNLVKMRNELFAHREKAEQREKERTEKYNASVKKKFEGDDLMHEADRAARDGDGWLADQKWAKAEAAYRDCKRLYSEYLST